MNIALRHLLHIHGNIATEGSPKRTLFPTLIQLLQLFKRLLWKSKETRKTNHEC